MNRNDFDAARLQVGTQAKVLEAHYAERGDRSWHVAIDATPGRRLVWNARERCLSVEEDASGSPGGRAAWRELWIKRDAQRWDLTEGIYRLLGIPWWVDGVPAGDEPRQT
jgi:hypothetical protein